jgi:hypothetical protein
MDEIWFRGVNKIAFLILFVVIHEGVWKHRGKAPFIVDLSIRGRWVVNFMLQLLYLIEESPLDLRLGLSNVILHRTAKTPVQLFYLPGPVV